MTEDEARLRITGLFGNAACDRIALFLGMLIAENGLQNLIAPASVPSIWTRHALDSAQLLALAPADWESWLDIGTGGGFPGMVIALLAPERRVTLVEPRRKRADFLQRCVNRFALTRATVEAGRVESIALTADIISARAVGAPQDLLRAAAHCAKKTTTWLLPRGRSGVDEQLSYGQTMFHVEHSVTDAESVILVARGTTR